MDYGRINYLFEKYYPILTGVIGLSIFLFYTLYFDNKVPKNIDKAISQSVSLGAIFAGFLYTAKSLLFALPDRPFVQRIVDMGSMEQLVGYITKSAYHWIFISFLSLIYIIINGIVGENINYVIHCLWVGAISMAAASFFRSVRLVSKLLKEAA